MRIEIDNVEIRFHPEDLREETSLSELSEETSFSVEGARFSKAFVSGGWDGREVLIAHRRGRWTGPIGLLTEALERFPDASVHDARKEPGTRVPMRLDPDVIPNLRPYQRDAVAAVLEDRGVLTGKGLLRLPTRSGKTVIAAAIISELGYRALFLVNSEMLLQQTVAFFRRAISADPLEGPLVGQYGGGVNEVGFITVASVQSVTQHLERKVVRDLLKGAGIVFFDECHHLEAPLWRKALTLCDARYKVGLSATIYLDRLRQATRGTIWLIGSTGPVLFELEPSDLIEQGWLCRPVFTIVNTPSLPWDIEGLSYQTAYRTGIVEHEQRNALVARLAREERDRGNRILITVRQINHAKLIEAALAVEGLSYVTVTGQTPSGRRRELTDLVRARSVDVLLGTVFGEAVDLPFLECVIIADAGASRVLAMQRLRNLTPTGPGDTPLLEPMEVAQEVPVYDFADFDHKTLRAHSLERVKTYRSHRAFVVRWRRS